MMTVAAGVGGGPLRSESARLPGVTLALAAPGPPVQLRWTTLRVQGPTLRDAALANGGNGSPPVAPRLLHQPLPRVPPNRDSTVPDRDSTGPDSNSHSIAGGAVFEEDFPKSIDTQEIAVVPGTSQQAE